MNCRMIVKENKHGPREYSATLVHCRNANCVLVDNPQGIGKTADEALGDLIVGCQRSIDWVICESDLEKNDGDPKRLQDR